MARGSAAYSEQVADSGSNDRSVTTETHDHILPQGPKTPGHALFVIESDAQPVADLWLGPFAPGVGFVMSVEVRPAFRGRGFARSATAIAEEQALAAPNTFLGLNVFGHNEVAIGLYHRIGYEVFESHRSLEFHRHEVRAILSGDGRESGRNFRSGNIGLTKAKLRSGILSSWPAAPRRGVSRRRA